MANSSADTLIEELQLASHPEGGWYRETWRAEADKKGRSAGTAIIFLLRSDEASHWHTVDAEELWFWQGGDPIQLRIAASDQGPVETVILGGAVDAGQTLQAKVPTGAWQAARPAHIGTEPFGYSLMSCVVVPGFEFAGFRLAPAAWEPGQAL